MRQFQKVLHELKDVVSNHRAGEPLVAPASLPSMDINGRRLSYAVAGPETSDAPPVILLHGFGGFFMDWPRVMAPVARHTRVYALDLPGWGFSEPHLEARRIEDDVAVLNEFMTKLGLSRVILCGLSYGGGVGWASAAMGLARIQRVVLLNPMPTDPLRFLRSPIYRSIFMMNSSTMTSNLSHGFLNKALYKVICSENLLNHRLLDTFYLDLAYMVIKQPKIPFMLHAHSRGAREVNWGDWEHRLAGISIPVSILQGTDDRIFSMQSAKHLHRLIPTSELIEIQDCGHAMVFDQHRKVSDFLIKLLNKTAARKDSHELLQKDLRQKRTE